MDTSAEVATGVVAEEVLLAGLGSLLDEVTVALFVIEPLAFDETV